MNHNDENKLEFTIPAESSALRLDKFLSENLEAYSRSRVQQWIREGLVSVNDQIITKTGMKLEKGDKIIVTIPPQKPVEIIPEKISLSILFEDSDLIVINKPSGMVVHPSAGHEQGTLVNAILAHAPDIEGVGGEIRPGVVHRLDKGTSGILLMAKNDFAHQWLQNQFRDREVDKTYLTLVDGQPPTPNGRIEAAIGRDLVQRKRMAVVSPDKGRDAISIYHTEKKFEAHTYMRVKILTGRTHQIRLHMAFIGCPVVGDTTYGRRHPSIRIKRNFLHAHILSICLPGADQKTTFTAPLPEDLNLILSDLEGR